MWHFVAYQRKPFAVSFKGKKISKEKTKVRVNYIYPFDHYVSCLQREEKDFAEGEKGRRQTQNWFFTPQRFSSRTVSSQQRNYSLCLQCCLITATWQGWNVSFLIGLVFSCFYFICFIRLLRVANGDIKDAFPPLNKRWSMLCHPAFSTLNTLTASVSEDAAQSDW